MICLAIYPPDGLGGFASDPWGAWTSSDVEVTHSGVDFAPNTIVSMDRLSNSFDASQAKGGVPSPITGSVDIVDALAIGRISSEMFAGAAPFMGWRIRIWLGRKRSGEDLAEPWNQDEFACSGADHDGDTIRLDILQKYALNARTIGTGVGGQVVGLVVGQHDVVVPTPELPDPVAIERTDLASGGAWRYGVPGAPLPAPVAVTRSTSKRDFAGDDQRFFFRCRDVTEANRVAAIVEENGAEVVAAGSTYACSIRQLAGAYATVGTISGSYGFEVLVTQDFYDNEAPEDVALYLRSGSTPIVAGAESLIGWLDDGKVLDPLAEVTIDATTYVMSARPRVLTPDGFLSLSRIPCSVTWADTATPPSARVQYLGNVASIPTDGTTAAADSYNATTLQPTSGPSSVTMWQTHQYPPDLVFEQVLPLRLHVKEEDAKGFSAFVVDSDIRSIWYNGGTFPMQVSTLWPWFQTPDASIINDPIAIGETKIHSKPLKGIDAAVGSQRFASVDLINSGAYADAEIYATGPGTGLAANYQIRAINLYGVSNLSPGSTEAIVRPGPSIYPDSSVSTITAAQYILQAAGGNVYNINDPFGNFGPVNQAWLGAYIEPDKTLAEAAHDLANDLWYVLPPASNRSQLASMPEVFEAPEVPLGRLEDVVTEPVIEYGNGLRAYVQNIDRAFDPARPDDYYGGWGYLRDDVTGAPLINYGYEAWSICREAYLRHGIKASETFKAPSIQEPDALGYIWTQTKRNGAGRLYWLANPPRFATFKVATDAPGFGFAWAGARVTIPGRMAEYAGMDWSAWGAATEGATITEASLDPVTLEITYTVILPPTLEIPGASPWINDSETGDWINDSETGDYINDVEH